MRLNSSPAGRSVERLPSPEPIASAVSLNLRRRVADGPLGMGAWDVGIFDNDTSADVRGLYEDALAEDERTAAGRVLEQFAEDLDEPEIAPDVWFGLAATQWEYGRPDPEIVQRALAIIDDGSDLARWRALGADEESLRARAEALQAFREQLRSKPPPPTEPAPRRKLPVTRFTVGDILAYELPSRIHSTYSRCSSRTGRRGRRRSARSRAM